MEVNFNEFLDIFNKILSERQLSKVTANFYRLRLSHILKKLGDQPIRLISVSNISEFLWRYPPCISNQYRGILADIFKHAIGMGYAKNNPALSTIPRPRLKKRQRMSLDGFYAIRSCAPGWLQNSMDLAIHTLQRRNDICSMRFKDIEDGYLKVVQEKTKKHGAAAYLKIYIEPSLHSVITNCRGDNVLAPFLVHRLPEKNLKQNLRLNNREHVAQVLPDYLTKAFNKARKKSEFYDYLSMRERPTFHEIRALGAKLYKDSGVDPQPLLGHTNKKMTDEYLAGHENIWTNVKAGLILQ